MAGHLDNAIFFGLPTYGSNAPGCKQLNKFFLGRLIRT